MILYSAGWGAGKTWQMLNRMAADIARGDFPIMIVPDTQSIQWKMEHVRQSFPLSGITKANFTTIRKALRGFKDQDVLWYLDDVDRIIENIFPNVQVMNIRGADFDGPGDQLPPFGA